MGFLFPHAYPIELVAFVCAGLAVIIGAVGLYDSILTSNDVLAEVGDDHELYFLSRGKVESAAWNFAISIMLTVVATVSIFLPPPPSDSIGLLVHMDPFHVVLQSLIVRTVLSVLSVCSIVRDIRVMRLRRRILCTRASRRVVVSVLEETQMSQLTTNIKDLNTTLTSTHQDSKSVENETLTTVKETKDIANEINDKLTDRADHHD